MRYTVLLTFQKLSVRIKNTIRVFFQFFFFSTGNFMRYTILINCQKLSVKKKEKTQGIYKTY